MKISSLSKSFILRLVPVLALIQLLMFLLTYRLELAEMELKLRHKVDAVGRIVAYASQKVLEENDVTDLGLLVDESLKDKDFAFFKLEDINKYAAIERKGSRKSDVVATYKVTKGAEVLGTLSIGYSLEGIKKAMTKRMLAKGGEFALLFAAMSVVVIILFRSRVASRVAIIESSLGKVTNGDLTVLIDDRKDDEISRVAEGINYLVSQLGTSFKKIAALSEASSKTTGELVSSFDESLEAMARQHKSAEGISVALNKATESYELITSNTRQLHNFSEKNTHALQQSVITSNDIAERIEQLNSGMINAQMTVNAINSGAERAAYLAEEATREVRKGSSSADNVRNSIAMITEVIKASAAQSDRTTEVISEKGIVAVSETTSSMQSIHLLAESLTESMLQLDAGSSDIAKIVSVIEDITKRIRLLSLNTSIIAAHAGEHGKSFLVVAEEMKQLSDQTANHTTEIAEIINSIQHGIGDAVEKTRSASRLVENGSRVVAHAGDALEEILLASKDSASMARKVMEASAVQQGGLEEILSSLGHLEKLNIEVSSTMKDEQSSICSFTETIGALCESMEFVKKSTDEQVVTMRQVMGNLLGANGQISQIASEIVANQQENLAIAESVATVIDVTSETVATLKEASTKLTIAFSGIDQLREEIEQFKL